MQEIPMQVLELAEQHPVRCKRVQREAFLADARRLLEEWGYSATVSEDRYGCRNDNLIAGKLSGAKLVFTAHYDTPYRMLVGSNTVFPKNLLLTILAQLPIVLLMIAMQIAALAGAALLGAPLWAAQLAGLVALVLAFWLLGFCVPNPHNRNDNTSGVVSVLSLAASLPPELREHVAFVLFDNEEKGMLGAAGFRKKYRAELKGATIFNFDCVGEGAQILLLQSGPALKDAALCAALEAARPESERQLCACSAKGYLFPSDHMLFQKHVAAAAFLEKKPFGLYINKLHTAKDTELDLENVRLLRDWMHGVIKGYLHE